MPVTTISSRFCQRERFRSVESLRVMSFEPTASTSISPQVNTIVALSLKNPCCQKIISSGLRCMTGLRAARRLVLTGGRSATSRTRRASDEAKQTQQQSLPIAARDKVEAGQRNAHPQQQAAEEPKRRPFGRNGPAHRPPQAAEETSRPAQRPPPTPAPDSEVHSSLSSCSSRMALSSLATQCHAFKQPIASPATNSASVQECVPG